MLYNILPLFYTESNCISQHYQIQIYTLHFFTSLENIISSIKNDLLCCYRGVFNFRKNRCIDLRLTCDGNT